MANKVEKPQTDTRATEASAAESNKEAANSHGTVDPSQIAAISGGYHGRTSSVLGQHVVTVDGDMRLVIRAFRPLDEAVDILDTIAVSEMPEPELADVPPQVLSGLIRNLRARIS